MDAHQFEKTLFIRHKRCYHVKQQYCNSDNNNNNNNNNNNDNNNHNHNNNEARFIESRHTSCSACATVPASSNPTSLLTSLSNPLPFHLLRYALSPLKQVQH